MIKLKRHTKISVNGILKKKRSDHWKNIENSQNGKKYFSAWFYPFSGREQDFFLIIKAKQTNHY